MHKHPAIDAILEYRGLSKLASAFIEPTLEVSKKDGRVHPRLLLTKVKSGRVACSDPNLMAFPTRDEFGKRIRSCFIADPGHVMFSVDYSQIEPRLVAGLSQDPILTRIYRERRDIYTETASRLFHISPNDVDKTRHRLPAKIVTLGVFYGMGPDKLFEELIRWGCGTPDAPLFSLEQCGELIQAWFEVYKGVGLLAKEIVRQTRQQDGWVYTLGGRGRMLPAVFLEGNRWPNAKLREEAERQAFNHVIQGTAQEWMKNGMLAAYNNFAFEPLLQIHDELVGQLPVELEEDLVPAIAEAMEFDSVMGVSLVTEFSSGPDWGSLK